MTVYDAYKHCTFIEAEDSWIDHHLFGCSNSFVTFLPIAIDLNDFVDVNLCCSKYVIQIDGYGVISVPCGKSGMR